VFSRCFEPLYLKNCWTYQNEHGSIRSSSAPFFNMLIVLRAKLLFRTCQIYFFTRKPAITELNFEVNRIEVYIVLMGKHTFLLLFMWFFRLTLCLTNPVVTNLWENVSEQPKFPFECFFFFFCVVIHPTCFYIGRPQRSQMRRTHLYGGDVDARKKAWF